MATRKPEPRAEQIVAKLNLADRRFWQAAFLAAEMPLLTYHDGHRLSVQGAAHLCSEFADAALDEYRMRFSK
jgi:hypothetical protein